MGAPFQLLTIHSVIVLRGFGDGGLMKYSAGVSRLTQASCL